MVPEERTIAHVDMDAFYAAIEVRDDPRYRGLPVVVGAPPRGRGVVAAASYEARRYGIRSAMPSREAWARCPDAVFLPVDMDKYRTVSARLFDLLETFTPHIEPLSIDEAFLDLTGCPVPAPAASHGRGRPTETSTAPDEETRGPVEQDPAAGAAAGTAGMTGGECRGMGDGAAGAAPHETHDDALDPGLAIARAIKARIRDVLRLPVSIGVAHNKFLAKLASELAKPDGLRRIRPREVEAVLDPLPVTALWGVGEETRQRLRALGIATVGAIRRTPTSTLRASLGFAAEHLARLSRGLDDRPVAARCDVRSIGRETTFEEDTSDQDLLLRTLAALAEDVAHRLRAEEMLGQTVTVKVRYGDFRTVTRSTTLAWPADAGMEVYQAAARMWARLDSRRRPVRLLGISVSRFTTRGSVQLMLFGDGERRDQVDRTVDAINARFGDGTVRHGRIVGADDPGRAGRQR